MRIRPVARLLQVICFALASLILSSPAFAEMRFALVIGNAGYAQRPLATTLNDAGLIAETLRTAGFDVTEGADLDHKSLTARVEQFLTKIAEAGPQAVAFVYLSGYGVQADCDNFYVPVDARLTEARNLAAETLRISDLVRALSDIPAKARVVVLDAARNHPFRALGQSKGFSIFEAPSGSLVAFNAAPGMTASDGGGPYGTYAPALSEMLRMPGLSLDQVFPRGRLRVEYETGGKQYPWNDTALAEKIVMFERDSAAPAPETTYLEEKRNAPLRSLPADEAYFIAVERDTAKAYEEFLAAHGANPLAKRIRAMLSLRREGVAWCRARAVNTPEAYWTYVKRHPRGRYVPEARVELLELAAPMEPPQAFTEVWWEDLPPPGLVPYEEEIFVEESWNLLPPAPQLLPYLAVLPFLPPLYLMARPAPPPLFAPFGLLPRAPVLLAPGARLAVAPPVLPPLAPGVAPRPGIKLPLSGSLKPPPVTLPNQKPWWLTPGAGRPPAGLLSNAVRQLPAVPAPVTIQPQLRALPSGAALPPLGAISPGGLPRPGQIPGGGVLQPGAPRPGLGAIPQAPPVPLSGAQPSVGQGQQGSTAGGRLRPQLAPGLSNAPPPRVGLPPHAAGTPPFQPRASVPSVRGSGTLQGPRGPVLQPRVPVGQPRLPIAPRVAAPPQFRPSPVPQLRGPPPPQFRTPQPQFRPPPQQAAPQFRPSPVPQLRGPPPPQFRAPLQAAPQPQFRPLPQAAPRPQPPPPQQAAPSRRCGVPGTPPCR